MSQFYIMISLCPSADAHFRQTLLVDLISYSWNDLSATIL